MPVHNLRTRALRVLAAGAILASVTTVGLSSSSAAGILPTTTTVVSNKNPVLVGDTVRLTATVKILGINLGPITPTGTVTFSQGTTTLGTAPVGTCLILLKQCTATLVIAAPTVDFDDFEPDQVTISARYNGDVLAKPSTGTVVQEVVEPRTCNATFSCQHSENSANGSAELFVSVNGDGESGTLYPISISFTSDPLTCSRANVGDTGVFDVGLNREKFVEYTIYNQAAVNASPDPNRTCWASDTAFPGAVFTSGLWQGLIPLCGDGANDPPCVQYAEFTPAQGPDCDCDPRARLETGISAPAGDPRVTK